MDMVWTRNPSQAAGPEYATAQALVFCGQEIIAEYFAEVQPAGD